MRTKGAKAKAKKSILAELAEKIEKLTAKLDSTIKKRDELNAEIEDITAELKASKDQLRNTKLGQMMKNFEKFGIEDDDLLEFSATLDFSVIQGKIDNSIQSRGTPTASFDMGESEYDEDEDREDSESDEDSLNDSEEYEDESEETEESESTDENNENAVNVYGANDSLRNFNYG